MTNFVSIINKFFTLYDCFIQLDLKMSLVYGRQYSHYKEMFLFYVTVLMNDYIDETDKEKKYVELRYKIVKFILENSKKHNISRQHSSTIAFNKKLNNVLQNNNEAYLDEFLKSIQFFYNLDKKYKKMGVKLLLKKIYLEECFTILILKRKMLWIR